MKDLTLAQATRCEHAAKPRCRCRCRGTLHGAQRTLPGERAEEYAALPADDPHHVQNKKARVMLRYVRWTGRGTRSGQRVFGE